MSTSWPIDPTHRRTLIHQLSLFTAFCMTPMLGAVDLHDRFDQDVRPIDKDPFLSQTGPKRAGDVTARSWGVASFFPSRSHVGQDATYDQRVYEAGLEAGLLSDERASVPWSLNLRVDGELRDHNLRKQGTVIPVIVTSGTEAATAIFGAPEGSTETAPALRQLTDNTLPTRTMHRLGVTVDGRGHFDRKLGVYARLGADWSRSLGGVLDEDYRFEAAVSWRFHDNEELLIGATYDQLTPYASTEGKVLPLLEWRATYSDSFTMVLAFPRMGVDWRPWEGSYVRARYAFPGDAEIAITQDIWDGYGVLSLGVEMWHRGHAFTAGTQEFLRDITTDIFFPYPIRNNFNVGEENHLYIRESGAAINANWLHERWNLRASASLLMGFNEYWYLGTSRDDDQIVASLDDDIGFRFQLQWSY